MLTPIVQMPYDRHPVDGASFADLDRTLVERVIRSARELGRYDGSPDPASYLERFSGVVRGSDDTLVPTVAGLLAFAQEPDRWLTCSGIDIAMFGTEQTLPTSSRVRQVRGPLFQVIDSAVALLQELCTTSRLEGARLVAEIDTPQIVLRELTTNAVVHRDLSIYGSQVRIHVYPTVIEWSSPGGLPGNITIETLLTAQYARNPTLAQFLFHGGYIEKFGMGLDAVIDALRLNRLSDPEFYDDRHSFRVRVRRAAAKLPSAPDLRTREGRSLAILELFTRRQVWQQHELQQHLDISRSTLQRDLAELVREGRLVVRGATKNRVYLLPDSPDSL